MSEPIYCFTREQIEALLRNTIRDYEDSPHIRKSEALAATIEIEMDCLDIDRREAVGDQGLRFQLQDYRTAFVNMDNLNTEKELRITALEAQLNTLRNFVANLGIITQDETVWVAARPHIHDQAWKLVPPEDER